jgi:hypothetical protein
LTAGDVTTLFGNGEGFSAIPEPSTIGLLALGLGVLGFRRQQRRK